MDMLMPVLLVAAVLFIGAIIFLAVRPPRANDAAPVTTEQEPARSSRPGNPGP